MNQHPFDNNLNCLEVKIKDVTDQDFQKMVGELCDCIGLRRDDFDGQRFSFLLMAIGRQGRTLSKQHLHGQEQILTTKVNKLSPNSVVYHLCQELVRLKNTHIEMFDGKPVLSLIKSCYKASYPKLTPTRKPTRNVRRDQSQTALIVQKRKNGVFGVL